MESKELNKKFDKTLSKITDEEFNNWLYMDKQKISLEANKKFVDSLTKQELEELIKPFDNYKIQ